MAGHQWRRFALSIQLFSKHCHPSKPQSQADSPLTRWTSCSVRQPCCTWLSIQRRRLGARHLQAAQHSIITGLYASPRTSSLSTAVAQIDKLALSTGAQICNTPESGCVDATAWVCGSRRRPGVASLACSMLLLLLVFVSVLSHFGVVPHMVAVDHWWQRRTRRSVLLIARPAFMAKAAILPLIAALSHTPAARSWAELCRVSAAAHLQQAGDVPPLWLWRPCFGACGATTCADTRSVCMFAPTERVGSLRILGVCGICGRHCRVGHRT